MSTTSAAAAEAIAATATAWGAYQAAPQTLDGARPDPGALLEACAQLKTQMPDFDSATRSLPWETDPNLDPEAPEAPEGPGWVDAAFEVIYEIHVLNHSTSVTNQAHHLIQLSNAVGDLISWHPRYDAERGEIGLPASR